MKKRILFPLVAAVTLGAGYLADPFNWRTNTQDKSAKVEKLDFPDNHTALEDTIEKIVKSYRARGVIRSDEMTSFAAFDINRKEYVGTINAEVPRDLASQSKTFGAVGFMHEAQTNPDLPYDKEAKKNMHLALYYSNNEKADWLTRKAGGNDAVNAFFNEKGIGLNLVQYIEDVGGGEYENHATTKDNVMLFYLLHEGKLPGSDEILKHTRKRDRTFHNRLLKRTHIPPGCKYFGKTGSTNYSISETAIIDPPNCNPYVISFIVEEKQEGENKHPREWIADQNRFIPIFRDISNATYDFMKKR